LPEAVVDTPQAEVMVPMEVPEVEQADQMVVDGVVEEKASAAHKTMVDQVGMRGIRQMALEAMEDWVMGEMEVIRIIKVAAAAVVAITVEVAPVAVAAERAVVVALAILVE